MRRIRTLAPTLPQQTRLLLVLAVWISLFLYAGRPLLVAAAAGGIAPALAWGGLLALSALPLLTLLFRGRAIVEWVGYVTMSVFSLLLMLVIVGDVVRLTWRDADVRTISFITLGAAGFLALVGLAQARRPAIKRVTVPIDGLPEALDGYRIVQLSDVHVGPTIRKCFVQSLVERTNALDADAIAITGDLVDGYLDDLREQVQPLRSLRARDGVFYVTGNHEYYWRASEWVREIESLGITFLKNQHRVVRRGDAQVAFAGVTDPVGRQTHQQDPHGALANAPREAVKVLLSHRPQTAKLASKLGVHLQLSGHTHGGQFFPFNLFIKYFQPIVAGLHKVDSTWLYVNRGTGYWGPPTRLGVGGEITVLELRRAV